MLNKKKGEYFMDFLEYIGSIVRDGVEYYAFKVNGKQVIYDLNTSIKMINSFDAKSRNCKVVRGRISFKPNEGTNKAFNYNIKTKYKDDIVLIYTEEKYKRSAKYIKSNDKFFKQLMQSKYKEFMQKYSDLIYKIDKAKIIDYELFSIRTEFGTASYSELSTGLKTLLNALFIIQYKSEDKYILNMNECGANVYDDLFRITAGTNVGLYLSNGTGKCQDTFKFKINDKYTVNSFYDILSMQLW